MTTYTARAKRWERGWELHIDGVGVTQSHGLADAETMARSYIAMMTETAPDSFAVAVVPEVGDGLDEAAINAREAVKAAEEAQRKAAAESRQIACKLHDRGLSGRDISAVLGVSPQRVSQLLRPTSGEGGTAAGSGVKVRTYTHKNPKTGKPIHKAKTPTKKPANVA